MGPPESASAGGPSFICRLPHENPLVSPPAMVIISVLIQCPVALSAFENPVSARSGMRGQLLPVEGLRQCGRKVCGTHQRQCRSDLTRVMRAQLERVAWLRRPATAIIGVRCRSRSWPQPCRQRPRGELFYSQKCHRDCAGRPAVRGCRRHAGVVDAPAQGCERFRLTSWKIAGWAKR